MIKKVQFPPTLLEEIKHNLSNKNPSLYFIIGSKAAHQICNIHSVMQKLKESTDQLNALWCYNSYLEGFSSNKIKNKKIKKQKLEINKETNSMTIFEKFLYSVNMKYLSYCNVSELTDEVFDYIIFQDFDYLTLSLISQTIKQLNNRTGVLVFLIKNIETAKLFSDIYTNTKCIDDSQSITMNRILSVLREGCPHSIINDNLQLLGHVPYPRTNKPQITNTINIKTRNLFGHTIEEICMFLQSTNEDRITFIGNIKKYIDGFVSCLEKQGLKNRADFHIIYKSKDIQKLILNKKKYHFINTHEPDAIQLKGIIFIIDLHLFKCKMFEDLTSILTQYKIRNETDQKVFYSFDPSYKRFFLNQHDEPLVDYFIDPINNTLNSDNIISLIEKKINIEKIFTILDTSTCLNNITGLSSKKYKFEELIEMNDQILISHVVTLLAIRDFRSNGGFNYRQFLDIALCLETLEIDIIFSNNIIIGIFIIIDPIKESNIEKIEQCGYCFKFVYSSNSTIKNYKMIILSEFSDSISQEEMRKLVGENVLLQNIYYDDINNLEYLHPLYYSIVNESIVLGNNKDTLLPTIIKMINSCSYMNTNLSHWKIFKYSTYLKKMIDLLYSEHTKVYIDISNIEEDRSIIKKKILENLKCLYNISIDRMKIITCMIFFGMNVKECEKLIKKSSKIIYIELKFSFN